MMILFVNFVYLLLNATVQKRPGLYNIEIPEYADKIAKRALWADLCEIFIKDWHDLEGIATKYRLLKSRLG